MDAIYTPSSEWARSGQPWEGKVTEDGRVVLKHSEEEAAKTHAEAFNELLAGCIAERRCAKKEARWMPNGRAWYFRLYGTDLRELGAQAE